MTTIFRVLMVLVGFFSASIAFAGDSSAVACGNCQGSDVGSSSNSSSNSPVSGSVGYSTTTEIVTKSDITLWKCGAPTIKVATHVYMTRNNGPEVNDTEKDVTLALLSQGYHFYKGVCSRGRFAQGRTVTITVE